MTIFETSYFDCAIPNPNTPKLTADQRCKAVRSASGEVEIDGGTSHVGVQYRWPSCSTHCPPFTGGKKAKLYIIATHYFTNYIFQQCTDKMVEV